MRVLVLYDERHTHIGALWDHLQALAASRHEVQFASGLRERSAPPTGFDAIVVHYSVRLTFPQNPVGWLRSFKGSKLLFIQDEYEGTESARRHMEQIGFDTIFTIIPKLEDAETIYPSSRFPDLAIVPVLTGYAGRPSRCVTRIKDRYCRIAYRGRELPYSYGDLGQDKVEIGRKMRAFCLARSVPHDIQWDDKLRIYGEAWIDFLARTRATLITESGSNVFDWDGYGYMREQVARANNPRAPYEKIRDILGAHDGPIKMNQISAKVFEAVGLRTALVGFPGEYSGVLKPEHYIRLEKDFSNIDQVLAKLEDTDALQVMVDRAYEDIIDSGKWSYDKLTEVFDKVIDRGGAPDCVKYPTRREEWRGRSAVTVSPLRPHEALERELIHA